MKTYQTIPLSGQSNMVIRYLEGVGIASLSTKPVGRCGAGSATRPKKNYPRPARGPSLLPPPPSFLASGRPPPAPHSYKRRASAFLRFHTSPDSPFFSCFPSILHIISGIRNASSNSPNPSRFSYRISRSWKTLEKHIIEPRTEHQVQLRPIAQYLWKNWKGLRKGKRQLC
jgi:hypothetical protein